MSKDEQKCADGDYAIGLGVEFNGGQLAMHHGGDHSVGLSVLRKPVEGKALAPGQRFMRRQPDGRYVPIAPRQGPAQVATPAYRDGWEGVFGAKRAVGQA